MQSLSIAATGMMAQQLNVEVISNNIANMSTTGYKAQRAEFQDLLYQNMRRVGTNSSDSGTIVPAGIQIGLGVKTGSVYRIMTQGGMQVTDSKLDVAIQGAGYFRIQMPSGEDAYSRAGSFQLSPDGQIVTSDGYTVAPGITIPTDATDVTISNDGQVQVKLAGQTATQVVGQLELATFQNDVGLDPQGNNLFMETPASGPPITGTPGSSGFGTVLQGFLETSNVDSVSEITSLITAQRAYEMNAKIITAADEMMSATNNIK
ncbi:MAG: flagellar basal-body rod protein FlgG [Parvibaculum sp.]